jgi:hypothetical protein
MKAYAEGREAAAAEQAQLERLCAMLRQGGAQLADVPSARIISGLANAGVFRLGAVLVGTHAFVALANVLGVRWRSSLRTQDVDVAVDRVLEVGVPQTEADLPKALEALNVGFLPVPGLNPKAPSTSFKVRGQSLRVDLLTPARGPRDGKPVHIERLKAAAQPLELLDYLLESALPAPLVNGSASLVNVPDPARFALYKLIVSKDGEQATELLEVLYEDRRGDLRLALRALRRRGPAWIPRLRRAASKLKGEQLAGAKAIVAG